MKKRFFAILIFLLGLLIADFFIGSILEKGFYSQRTGPDFQIFNSFRGDTSSVVLFGNSRAQHHYNSKLIADSLNLSFNNSGIVGGHGVFLFNFQVHELLKVRKPKVILIEMDPNSLGYWKGDYERLSVLLPFCNHYEKATELVKLKGEYQELKLLSKTYKFNSLIYSIFIYNILSSKFNHVKSYIPLNRDTTVKQEFESLKIVYSDSVDQNKANSLINLIDLAQANGVEIVFIQSPVYLANSEFPFIKASERFFQILKDKNVKYWDYSNDFLFKNRQELFYDTQHLNSFGANTFSEIIAGKISHVN
jgi:hypothetical protein